MCASSNRDKRDVILGQSQKVAEGLNHPVLVVILPVGPEWHIQHDGASQVLWSSIDTASNEASAIKEERSSPTMVTGAVRVP
jgi:hypothetical protein